MQTSGYRRVVETKSWNRPEARTVGVAPAATPLEAAPPAAPRWPKARIAAVEALWGEGYTMPGGSPEALRIVKPLGLSSSMTVLLLGGGLGGPAQTIHGNFGTWVTSFEADPELAAAAAACIPKPEFGSSRITVSPWDRAAPAFRPRIANHAFLLEALRGTRPAPLLEGVAGALRADSQIVLTELVCDDPPNEKDREFAAWCRLDNRLPELPRSQDVTDTLLRLGFEVRVAEDMSDRHISQTLGGWRDAVRAMAAGPRPTAHTAAVFVTEAELWLLRIRLMRRLGVRLMRWHAIQMARS